jgi:hypothetical protein
VAQDRERQCQKSFIHVHTSATSGRLKMKKLC